MFLICAVIKPLLEQSFIQHTRLVLWFWQFMSLHAAAAQHCCFITPGCCYLSRVSACQTNRQELGGGVVVQCCMLGIVSVLFQTSLQFVIGITSHWRFAKIMNSPVEMWVSSTTFSFFSSSSFFFFFFFFLSNMWIYVISSVDTPNRSAVYSARQNL